MYSKMVVWLKIVPMWVLLFNFLNNAVADTVVNVNIYEDDVLVQDQDTAFGLTTEGDADAKPFDPPGGVTSPVAYFYRSNWPEIGDTTNLKVDERLKTSTSAVWKFFVKVPTGYSKSLKMDFDATAFETGSEVGTVTITGGGTYDQKTITDKPYTGDDRLSILGNRTYFIIFTKVTASTLEVVLEPKDIGGKWALQSENPNFVWRDSGTKLVIQNLPVTDTLVFQDVVGYATPDPKPFTIGSSGYSDSVIYKKKEVRSLLVDYAFEGAAAPSEDELRGTFWQLKDNSTGDYYLDGIESEFEAPRELRGVPTGDLPYKSYTIEFDDVQNLEEAWITPDPFVINTSPGSSFSKIGKYTFIPAEASVSADGITMFDDGDEKKFTFTMDKKPTDDMSITIVADGDSKNSVTVSPATFTVLKDSFPAEGFSQEITVTSNDISIPNNTDPTLPENSGKFPAHSNFKLNINVNGPAEDKSPDPRYDGVKKVIDVKVLDQYSPDGGANLVIEPTAGVNLGDLKVGDAVTVAVLVKNLNTSLETNVEALTTDVTGQVSIDELFDVPAGVGSDPVDPGVAAFAFQFTATQVGVLDGTEIIIVAKDRQGKPVVATIPVEVEVVAATENALQFDPDIVAARPEDGNPVSIEFDVIANIGSSDSNELTATFTVPAEMTNLTFSDVLGGVDPTSSDNLTYTFTYNTLIAKNTEQKLFTVTADVSTDSKNIGKIEKITSTLVINKVAGAGQTAQLAIDNSVVLATLDVDGNGFVTFADTVLIYNTVVVWNKDLNDTSAVHPNTQVAATVIENVQASGDAYDVDGNGFVTFADTVLIYNTIVVWNKDLNDTSAVHPNSQVAATVIGNVKKIYPDLY